MTSDDGADFGATAEQGMKAAIGGEQPTKTLDPVEFEQYILSQEGPSDYSGTAAYCAKLILLHFRAHPEDVNIPTEPEYENDENGQMKWPAVKKSTRNLSDIMRPQVEGMGLSGFMWGWAVNAARRCCELPPVPNPAILTIEVK